MRARRTAAALALVVTGAIAAGCGGDDVTVTTPEGTVKIDGGGEEFTIEGENGEKVEGGTSLPDDFPEEVVLIEGTIVQAVSATGESGGFSVNLETEGDPASVLDQAAEKLVAAGFTREGTQSLGGAQAIAMLGNERWQVLVSVTTAGEGDALYVGYTVAAATP